MELKSSAFGNNEKIPSKYTCDGENISPPLSISDVPENAINWYDSGPTRLFSGMEIFSYYGGSGDPKGVNDHIDISEFYVTGISAIN